jgi:hypothetical protein
VCRIGGFTVSGTAYAFSAFILGMLMSTCSSFFLVKISVFGVHERLWSWLFEGSMIGLLARRRVAAILAGAISSLGVLLVATSPRRNPATFAKSPGWEFVSFIARTSSSYVLASASIVLSASAA